MDFTSPGSSIGGTPRYIAPEVLQGNVPIPASDVFGFAYIAGALEWKSPEDVRSFKSTCQSDIYSLGLLLWSMLTGKNPYQGMERPQVHRALIDNVKEKIPAGTPSGLSLLIGQCWQGRSRDRPTAAQVCDSLRSLVKEGGAVTGSVKVAPCLGRGLFAVTLGPQVSSCMPGSTHRFRI